MTDFGNIIALSTAPPTMNWVILPSTLSLAACQLFFTYRLWKFSQHNILYPLVAIPAVIAESVTYMVFMEKALRDPSFLLLHKHRSLAIGLMVLTAVTDVCLSLSMVYHLLKDRTLTTNLNRMIIWLIIFTVNSGMWTALSAVAVVATITVLPPTNLTFAAIYLITSPLYSNACLGNLIGRQFLRARGRQKVLPSSHHLDVFSEDTPEPQHSLKVHVQTSSFQDGSEPSNHSKSRIDRKEISLPYPQAALDDDTTYSNNTLKTQTL
jgi:hypothetical protein